MASRRALRRLRDNIVWLSVLKRCREADVAVEIGATRRTAFGVEQVTPTAGRVAAWLQLTAAELKELNPARLRNR